MHFPALQSFLLVFMLNSHWLLVTFSFVLIRHSNNFGFHSTTIERKELSRLSKSFISLFWECARAHLPFGQAPWRPAQVTAIRCCSTHLHRLEQDAWPRKKKKKGKDSCSAIQKISTRYDPQHGKNLGIETRLLHISTPTHIYIYS